MLKEAAAELAKIPPEETDHADVLAARIDFHLARREWRKMARLGEQLARLHPAIETGWIHWAYALRELNQVEAAKAVLIEAEARHGKLSGVLHYNLACYHCLLGEMDQARTRLRRAIRMDAAFKHSAREDPDLKAMHGDADQAT
jgi:tetratricopeptide (TPR) repeat protein